MSRNFINRKEIAAILEVSVDTVRRQEVPWGIHQFRRTISPRQVDYDRERVIAALNARRLLPSTHVPPVSHDSPLG
jgi:hypothetical protein